MSFTIKEIYFTLQGEGAHTGRAAVFCRFAGCNLWSGREQDRSSARCTFCDTDFVGTDGPGGNKFATAEDLVEALLGVWRSHTNSKHAYIVFTGGEPLLQLNDELIKECKRKGLEIAIETNGTLPTPQGIDWVCMSPKSGNPIKVDSGDELKLVFPQSDCVPESFEHLQFKHFFLQPMDGPNQAENIQLAAAYCQANPLWRLSLQTHKLIGLP